VVYSAGNPETVVREATSLAAAGTLELPAGTVSPSRIVGRQRSLTAVSRNQSFRPLRARRRDQMALIGCGSVTLPQSAENTDRSGEVPSGRTSARIRSDTSGGGVQIGQYRGSRRHQLKTVAVTSEIRPAFVLTAIHKFHVAIRNYRDCGGDDGVRHPPAGDGLPPRPGKNESAPAVALPSQRANILTRNRYIIG
jgi:hypothetical protein